MPCVWYLICFDIHSESVVWESRLEGGINTNPLLYCGKIFTSGGWCPWLEHADKKERKKIVCFDQFTGRILWKYPTKGEVCSSLSLSGTVLYAGSDDGAYALDANTGKVIWKREIDSQVKYSPVVYKDSIIVVSDFLYCLNKDNGNTVWKFQNTCKNSPVVAYDLIFCICETGLYALNDEGEIKWEKSMEGKGTITSSLAADEKLFLWSEKGILYALDVSTGSEIWHYDTKIYDETYPDGSAGSLAISDGIVVVCTSHGDVIAFGIEPETLLSKAAECEENKLYYHAYKLYNRALLQCQDVEIREDIEKKLSELIKEHEKEIVALPEFKKSLINAYLLIYQNKNREALTLLEELRIKAHDLNVENTEEITCLIEYLTKRERQAILTVGMVAGFILFVVFINARKIMRKNT